jgi:hypothetical protein
MAQANHLTSPIRALIPDEGLKPSTNPCTQLAARALRTEGVS